LYYKTGTGGIIVWFEFDGRVCAICAIGFGLCASWNSLLLLGFGDFCAPFAVAQEKLFCADTLFLPQTTF